MQPSLRHRLLNLLHSALLLAGMAAIAWISASAVAGPELAVYVLLGLVGGLIFAPVAPKEFLLSLYRARRLGARDFPDGVELLARLAARAGLPAVPALYYIPSSVPNAFALGGPADSAIAVTDGILRLLDRHEFAGVLAHEVAHIANRDLWLMGLADMMSRLTALLSYAGQIVLLLNLPLLLTGQVTVPWIAPLVLVFAPTIMSLLQLALSRTREFDADLGAARLTGDPLGLASALARLERRRGRFWEEILLPGRRMPDPSLLRTHPRSEDRIARLRELAAAGAQAAGEALPIRLAPGYRRIVTPPSLRWTGLWF